MSVNNLITAFIKELSGVPISEAVLLTDYRMSSLLVSNDDLDTYVDVMKSLTLLHSILRGVDLSEYETFNLEKIDLLRDPNVASKAMDRFQEKRRADLTRIDENIKTKYENRLIG